MSDHHDVVITVSGRAEGRRPPTEGAVTVLVSADGPHREPAVEAALHTHGALAAELRSIAGDPSSPIVRWSADRVVVTADRPWHKDGKRLPLVYRASASLSATFSDFGRLGEWIARAAATDRVNVGGVAWDLDDDARNELVEEVRRAAVADAVAKARVYADALEFAQVVPLELSEEPFSSPSPMRAFAAAPVGAMAKDLPVPTLEPADVVVEASVNVRFRAS